MVRPEHAGGLQCLMGRLTGPARLLAMSWSQTGFDANDGTLKLLRRLAQSPLVRKSLPNAAAICQQYFSFKRTQGQTIGNFLVRESLVREEFVEAHEEKLGVTQDQRDFGLPLVEETTEDWWADWYEDEHPSAAAAVMTPEPHDTSGSFPARLTWRRRSSSCTSCFGWLIAQPLWTRTCRDRLAGWFAAG